MISHIDRLYIVDFARVSTRHLAEGDAAVLYRDVPLDKLNSVVNVVASRISEEERLQEAWDVGGSDIRKAAQ